MEANMISLAELLLLIVFYSGGIVSIPIANDNDLAMENPELFEGDILGIDDWQSRNVAPDSFRRWPGAKIPYEINPELASQEEKIRTAMEHYAEKTCVRFVPRTNEIQYLNIFRGQGCYSHIGKTLGGQPLSLGWGCYGFGTIVHELGHAVGFFHEHSRSDRDDFIEIHWDNVRTGMESQFTKLRPKQNLLLDDFDFNSVMLYGETVFSKDHFLGLKTMTAKDPSIVLKDINEKPGLSDSDILRISKMYNCSSSTI